MIFIPEEIQNLKTFWRIYFTFVLITETEGSIIF